MTAELDLGFGVLGPLEVHASGKSLAIGGAKRRTVLAALLLNSNRLVTTDRLIEAVWPDAPPRSAVSNLQTYVSALRRCLPGGEARIRRGPAGYTISVAPGELDCRTFEELAGEAARMKAHGRPAEALELLGRALALWRGHPLEDLSAGGSVFDAEVVRLVESRLAAGEERVELLVAVGKYTEAVAEIRDLLEQHPFRERSWQQLMLALYRSGRRADALQTYVDIRARLIDELGVEPCPDLRETHRAILADDVALIAREPLGPDGTPSGPPDGEHSAVTVRERAVRPSPFIPAQLPHHVPGFTGRETELAKLESLVADSEHGPVVICGIDGAGGIGKTALAVHFAHRVACAFGDGQLYVDLRGFDPDQQPLAPVEVLGQFLRALGVDPEGIPADLTERATLYRSVLAGRRVLIMLDNAVAPDQVRPLLPGSSACLVLVTSRNTLAGLSAREGAHRMTLDVLSPDEAVSLLTRVVGAQRVFREPGAARELARLCGYLPLAVRIAGGRVAAYADYTLADLADELGLERDRLDVLSADGDEATAVRAAFSWSYRTLAPGEARVFRLLGLHASPEFGTAVAEAIVGVEQPGAIQRSLTALTNGHLLQQTGRHRYRFHDLVRLYAMERAAEEETARDRDAAVRRVLTWYLHSADAAGRVLVPHRRHVPLDSPEAGCEPAVFGTREEALAWCESERETLVAAARQAAETRSLAIAWKLPMALWDFFYLRKHWSDWISTHQLGLDAARRDGDQVGEAWMLTSLGNAYWEVRRHAEAFDVTRRALRIWRELGDLWGEGTALHLIAGAYMGLQRFTECIEHYRQALATHDKIDNRWGTGWTLTSLGAAYRELGRLDEAFEASQRARAIWSELGDRHGEGIMLNTLGDVCRQLGRVDDAVRYYRQALDLNRGTGNRWGEAWALNSIGKAMHGNGRPAAARTYWRRALTIFDELGDARAAEVREHLG